MADTTHKELANAKPGATAEKPGATVVTGPSGLYRHPETGAEVATRWDPLYGDTQSEAFIRTGFVRVGDVPEGYAKELVPGSVEAEARDARAGASVGDVKGIAARLDKLESDGATKDAEITRLNKLLNERDPAGFPGQENVKKDAFDRIESGQATGEAEGVTTGTENTPTAPNVDTQTAPDNTDSSDEKSLESQNTTELKATAAAEGVELTDSEDTKAKIREAIEAKRKESEKA